MPPEVTQMINRSLRRPLLDRCRPLSADALRHVTGGDSDPVDPLSLPPAQTEVASPRDPQSGLPTGQRMHKPFVIR
jgi:hypothetical protein